MLFGRLPELCRATFRSWQCLRFITWTSTKIVTKSPFSTSKLEFLFCFDFIWAFFSSGFPMVANTRDVDLVFATASVSVTCVCLCLSSSSDQKQLRDNDLCSSQEALHCTVEVVHTEGEKIKPKANMSSHRLSFHNKCIACLQVRMPIHAGTHTWEVNQKVVLRVSYLRGSHLSSWT